MLFWNFNYISLKHHPNIVQTINSDYFFRVDKEAPEERVQKLKIVQRHLLGKNYQRKG